MKFLLTSMDRDGTQSGFDLALDRRHQPRRQRPGDRLRRRKVARSIFWKFSREGAADAALAASIFHDQVQSIRALKSFLQENGVEVRLPC